MSRGVSIVIMIFRWLTMLTMGTGFRNAEKKYSCATSEDGGGGACAVRSGLGLGLLLVMMMPVVLSNDIVVLRMQGYCWCAKTSPERMWRAWRGLCLEGAGHRCLDEGPPVLRGGSG